MDEQVEPIILHKPQLDLFNALLSKDIKLARMYLGAIKVLNDMDNIDRFALAAHDLRELMEKLPYYIDVETKAHNETLVNKVQLIKKQWHETCRKTTCVRDGTWNGEIDKSLASMLREFGSFFKWHDENLPKRNEEITTALRKLDISGCKLPISLEEQNVKTWKQLRKYFIGISHHGKHPTKDDFDSKLDIFEGFLLDRLYPRTFTDLDEIDDIIQEGDNDA
ncbi:MAG: hypothetical protein PHY05_07970 [Methanothrix sp.]|nr:hypothetical protein [Methanothrix sp.]MDD4446204.1 hypothetical protein [Methanothrix sp.]